MKARTFLIIGIFAIILGFTSPPASLIWIPFPGFVGLYFGVTKLIKEAKEKELKDAEKNNAN